MLWFGLCLLPDLRLMDVKKASSVIPESGLYRIAEIRSGYAVATRGNDQVLVYEKDDLRLEETIELNRFEPIHTSRNSGLFSFMDYAANKKIFFNVETNRKERAGSDGENKTKDGETDNATGNAADGSVLHRESEKRSKEGRSSSASSDSSDLPDRTSLSESDPSTDRSDSAEKDETGEDPVSRLFHLFRQPVWDWVSSRKAASLYQLLFYGIHDNEDLEWIASLGLPLIGFVHVLRALLKRRMEPDRAGWVVMGIELVLALLFPVSGSLVRMICFVFCTMCFSSREKRMAFSILLTLLVRPELVRSMALVLPAGILFLSRFQTGPYRKKLVQMSFCVICQTLFMNKVNGLLLLVFGMMRKAWAGLCSPHCLGWCLKNMVCFWHRCWKKSVCT